MRGKSVRTGIFKYAKAGRHRIEELGVRGDVRVDRGRFGERNHALCAYPREHYDFWARYHHLRCELGQFGENLTVTGMLEKHVRVGDVFRCGTAVLQALHPRIPCAKLDARMGFKFSRMFLNSRRVGYYLRVVRPGTVSAGDPAVLLDRDEDAPTIDELLRATFLEYWDVEALEALTATRPLLAGWRQLAREKLGRARAASGWLGLRELRVVDEVRLGNATHLVLECGRGRDLPGFEPGQVLPLSFSENAKSRIAGHRYPLSGDPDRPSAYRITAATRARAVPNTPAGLVEATLPQSVGKGARVLAAAPQWPTRATVAGADDPPRVLITGGSGLGSAASHLHRLSRLGNGSEARVFHFGRDDVWWLMGRELDRLCDESKSPIVVTRRKDECDLEEVLRTLRLEQPAKAWIAGPAPFVDRARRAVGEHPDTLRLGSVDLTQKLAS